MGWRERRLILLRLLGFLWPFWRQTVMSVLAGAATVAGGIGLMGVSAYLIAYAALQPSIAELQVAIVGVRFFGISRAVFRYLERLASHSVNFHLLAGLRAWFYRRLEPLAPARLQDVRSADLLNQAVADIETLENFYVRAVASPLVALVILCGAGWFVGRFELRLALLLVGALLVAGLGLPLLAYHLGRATGQAMLDRRARLHAEILDAIQGMPDLLAYSRGEAQLGRVRAADQALGQVQRRIGRAGALVNALTQLLTGLTLWGMLLLAIPLVGSRIDGISLAVLALVTLASFEAVAPLAQAAQHLESSLHAAGRLFRLVEAPPAVVPPAKPLPAPTAMDLRIEGLSFTYLEDRQLALAGFDLDLPAGKHVAIVGHSGAGKTSLVNVLLRFWEYDQGTITLGGRDIRCFDPEDVRRLIALVPQTTYLFAGTLRQNLQLARPGASQADLDRVVRAAGLAELAAQLPEGLDTWVGERGLQLSGGERQRVAVARALLKDAPLLILDEPTANLDPASERRLLETLEQAGAGRSVIHITHRLAGLEKLDEILVLQDGRVVERGCHADLLAAGGPYRRMVDIQNSMLAFR